MSTPSNPVLDARNLGKAYSLTVAGSQKRRGGDIWRAVFQRKPKERRDTDKDLFWAVKDISITLQPGESLGVVGRNGAGKTTLMKMLSGILPPDVGSISVDGEIQAMVNLSGGIDKGLSGRQNIENAAALRGLSSKQLAERVDQIIAFAELENAIDRLVSTYSSGMKARLGFAICVHMDPSLLIIDEALAVGDTRFKQKCLRRLNEMRAGGVAMVLVSHSATQIRQFCERAIWLDDGEVRFDGTSADTLKAYQDYLDRVEDEDED
ncbi:MAG: ABC transporter ATP-binding protein, partial [Pseudomonadota bacterium]